MTNIMHVNFERIIVYDCLVHLASDGFEQQRLDILRICSQFGTVSQLSPVEIACIIQMFLTEYQLLNVYRHLFFFNICMYVCMYVCM